MAMTFDATVKDMGRDSPNGFLSVFDTPPTLPVKLLNVDLSTVTTAADLIPSDLASGKKNGFTFQMQGTPGGYTITANPDAFEGTGRRSFYSDQSLVIRNNWGPEPATASSPEIK